MSDREHIPPFRHMQSQSPAAADSPETYCSGPILKVQEIAAEWKLSMDTIQRLFVSEPDVFVIQQGRKRTLRIPREVKERVWRRMTNKRVM